MRILCAAAAFFMLCAAAMPQQARSQQPEARHSGIFLDVPFVKQSEDACGAAAIAMVLQYWKTHGAVLEDERLDANAIFDRLYSPKAKGIFASGMQQYFRDSGFSVFALAGRWDDLQEQIAKGRPLIAGLRPLAKSAALHYVVVTGVDETGDAVLLNDPARGKLLRLRRAEFEKEWTAVNRWLLLAVPSSAK
jgi:ABC-type bacteriocin/lantibiotic exporter with double-glycine peptidase domain